MYIDVRIRTGDNPFVLILGATSFPEPIERVVLGERKTVLKTRLEIEFRPSSNEANMSVQHHPTLLDATCWPRLNIMLEDVGLILNLLKISSNIMQHCWANNVV